MKRTHSSSAAQWKDWIRDRRAIMREFVGKSGKSYLAIWFEDKTFALFQKSWAEDPFSHNFIPEKNAKKKLCTELELEIQPGDAEYANINTYQLALEVLNKNILSKHTKDHYE